MSDNAVRGAPEIPQTHNRALVNNLNPAWVHGFGDLSTLELDGLAGLMSTVERLTKEITLSEQLADLKAHLENAKEVLKARRAELSAAQAKARSTSVPPKPADDAPQAEKDAYRKAVDDKAAAEAAVTALRKQVAAAENVVAALLERVENVIAKIESKARDLAKIQAKIAQKASESEGPEKQQWQEAADAVHEEVEALLTKRGDLRSHDNLLDLLRAAASDTEGSGGTIGYDSNYDAAAAFNFVASLIPPEGESPAAYYADRYNDGAAATFTDNIVNSNDNLPNINYTFVRGSSPDMDAATLAGKPRVSERKVEGDAWEGSTDAAAAQFAQQFFRPVGNNHGIDKD